MSGLWKRGPGLGRRAESRLGRRSYAAVARWRASCRALRNEVDVWETNAIRARFHGGTVWRERVFRSNRVTNVDEHGTRRDKRGFLYSWQELCCSSIDGCIYRVSASMVFCCPVRYFVTRSQGAETYEGWRQQVPVRRQRREEESGSRT